MTSARDIRDDSPAEKSVLRTKVSAIKQKQAPQFRAHNVDGNAGFSVFRGYTQAAVEGCQLPLFGLARLFSHLRSQISVTMVDCCGAGLLGHKTFFFRKMQDFNLRLCCRMPPDTHERHGRHHEMVDSTRGVFTCLTEAYLMCITKKRIGFTLIELVIVVLVLGIIAAVAAPGLRDVTTDAREKDTRQSLTTIRNAIELYRATSGSYPPASTLATSLRSS